MHHKLKKFLLISNLVLIVIHAGYFIYGYIHFTGLPGINTYTEFYRFKFYDEVSISQFFITGIFLLIVLILLLRNHSAKHYTAKNLLIIGGVLLLTVLNSLSFFMSYSFGMNAALRKALPEKQFNADKTLLNVLNPFLYTHGAYNSSAFKVTDILYPEPYPVTEQQDTIFYDVTDKSSFSTQSTYYSIDTLKLSVKAFEKTKQTADAVADFMDINKAELAKRVISQKTQNDSVVVIFKGREINPQYDNGICIFLQNKSLISALHDKSIAKQQRENAIKRYRLLYQLPADSLLSAFKGLDTLLKKYRIESSIRPDEITRNVLYVRNHSSEPTPEIGNQFDRNTLIEKMKTLDRLFYKPAFFHHSIRLIFVCVWLITWLFGFLIFVLVNYRKQKKQ